jgi:biopolymer transport protein ExbD
MSALSFRSAKQRERISLSVTPLIDVLFLLIIFFMLTGTFKRVAELELSLPESSTAELNARQENPLQLELIVTQDGRLLIGDEPVLLEALDERLREILAESPESSIVLKAESSVEHGRIVALLDVIRTAGFSGVGIGTRPSTKFP